MFEREKRNPSNKNYGSTATIIANLIFLAITRTPDLKIYHLDYNLIIALPVAFVVRLLVLPKENDPFNVL